MGIRLGHAGLQRLLRLRTRLRHESITGHFIEVPKEIATGNDPVDGSELTSADVGYPCHRRAPLADRPSYRNAGGPDRRPPVGARVLERHQPCLPVRSRRGHRVRQAPRHGERRLLRRLGPRPTADDPWTRRTSSPRTAASGRWCSTRRPDAGDSLTILLDGDDNPVKTLDEVHQPDNIETTQTGLLVTEDPVAATSSPRTPRPQRDHGAPVVRPVLVTELCLRSSRR